jgi:antirestriction protein ArdC
VPKKPTKDVYSRITEKIIADLEAGVHPRTKPWNAERAAGRINNPLRHNGQSEHQTEAG